MIRKNGGSITGWAMAVLGTLAASGVLGAVGFAFSTSNTDAKQDVKIEAHDKAIEKIEGAQSELQKQVSDVVSKGVESGVSQSLQKILEAIDENRSGAYAPARGDKTTGHD